VKMWPAGSAGKVMASASQLIRFRDEDQWVRSRDRLHASTCEYMRVHASTCEYMRANARTMPLKKKSWPVWA